MIGGFKMAGFSFLEKPQKGPRVLERECEPDFGQAAATLLGEMLRRTGLREVISQTPDTVMVGNDSGARIELVKTPQGLCFSLYAIPRPVQHALRVAIDHAYLAKHFGEEPKNHPTIEYK